jgi:hypothetical protein
MSRLFPLALFIQLILFPVNELFPIIVFIARQQYRSSHYSFRFFSFSSSSSIQVFLCIKLCLFYIEHKCTGMPISYIISIYLTRRKTRKWTNERTNERKMRIEMQTELSSVSIDRDIRLTRQQETIGTLSKLLAFPKHRCWFAIWTYRTHDQYCSDEHISQQNETR